MALLVHLLVSLLAMDLALPPIGMHRHNALMSEVGSPSESSEGHMLQVAYPVA